METLTKLTEYFIWKMITNQVFSKKNHANTTNHLEDMAVERFNNGFLGASHMTGCE